jgi:hypothetical protein
MPVGTIIIINVACEVGLGQERLVTTYIGYLVFWISSAEMDC